MPGPLHAHARRQHFPQRRRSLRFRPRPSAIMIPLHELLAYLFSGITAAPLTILDFHQPGELFASTAIDLLRGGIGGVASMQFEIGGVTITFDELLAYLFSGITITVLTILDFHRPYRVSDVRYAVLPERYYFALSLSAIFALIAYFFLVVLLVKSGLPVHVSLTAAILIAVLVPLIPIIGRFVAAIRRGMQMMVRYPQSVETVSAFIALSPLSVDPQAHSELIKDLKVNGVPSDLVDAALADRSTVLSPAASRSLLETVSLRICFERLKSDRRYRRFCAARADILENLDALYLQLIRRTARVIFLCEGQSGQKSSEVMLEASEFIAEEALELRSGYERLLAGAALSFAPGAGARTRLISRFGYHIDLPGGLPFYPIAIVFALDFFISLLPVIIYPFLPPTWVITLQESAIWSLP